MVLALAGAAMVPGAALAADAYTPARLDYACVDARPAMSVMAPDATKAQASAEPASLDGVAPAPAFGSEGSRWWILGGGVSQNFSDATDFNAFGAYSYFLIQDVEFSAELGAWYYAQTGDDALGLNPNMVLRWHFYNEGDMTIYADAGIGLVFTTDDVPPEGTSVNFTPRLGLGITHALDDAGTRLMVGVRWAHVSNARIEGDGENPSRDAAMAYVGVIFPF
jgi:hypothetical protein